MIRISVATLAFLVLVLPVLSAQEQLSQPQQGYTFQGTTLRWFGINIWDNDRAHAFCRAECAKDARCRAYAFVRIGAYHPNDGPVCYLMANVQSIVRSPCCIIAMKQRAPTPSSPQPPATPSAPPPAPPPQPSQPSGEIDPLDL